MAETRYLLTKDQENLVQWVIDRVRALPAQPPTGEDFEQEYVSPDVYIFRAPAGGIDPITSAGTGTGTASMPTDGDILGSGECNIYRANSNGVISDTGLVKTVYNLSSRKIPPYLFFTGKRDKFGTWIADPIPLRHFRGQTDADVPPGSSEDVSVFEGDFGTEIATGDIIQNVRNDTSCTIKSNQMVTIQEVPDNSGWQFQIYKTV